ncbi:MAG: amidohydrolase family protein [Candidatus Rokubacteria bacterium]|nr:amidohydrolase family protein [Candidatus Rokubacteria bacterium]
MRIIDADGHVMEPKGMWEDWIEPAFKARAPRVVKEARIDVDGHLVPRPDGGNQVSAGMQAAFKTKVGEFLAAYHLAGYSAEAQLKAMDEAGIETSFLYPTQGLYAASIDDLDPAFAIAICRAYNNWVLEYCKVNPRRLRPVAMLTALHDPSLAVGEATRVAGLGMRGVFIRPNPIRGRPLDDPAYEPYVREVLDFIGEGRLLFASDYPHPDRKWPETVDNARALPISDRAKQKLLWENPSAFYGLR